MKEFAYVVALLDEGRKAEILIKKSSACGDCGGCEGVKDREMIVNNNLGAKVGDKVSLELEEKDILRAAILIYLFPLIGLLAGYIIVEALGVASEGVKVAMGLSLFFLAFVGARYYGEWKKKDYEFEIIEIIEKKDENK